MPRPELAAFTTKGRIFKKKDKPINTDITAHLRSNPIGALNTLLKLLSSLPKRLGGCQLRLTPAEHALSLHLVSILDPYVYQGAKTLLTVGNTHAKPTISGLVYQPTEILDNIMAYLDSKRDLLHVALCCKHLHNVVFPRHFEYRLIRCKVSSISVWNHLLSNDSLARNVRKLEIVDERTSSLGTIIPRATTATTNAISTTTMVVPRGIMQRDTDLDSTDDELGMHKKQQKYLSLALQRMSGLKEFKWSCNHSPISIEHIWPSLVQRSASLDKIEIVDNLVFASQNAVAENGSDGTDGSESEHEGDDVACSASQSMSVVNAVFKSTRHNYGACKTPNLARITDILARCPSLKNLDVSFIRPRSSHASQLPRVNDLLDGRWAHLAGLTLTGLYCSSPSVLADFLAEHQLLQTIHLDVAGIHTLDLRPGCLPKLREIHASKDIINNILESDVQQLRPLVTVKGFKLSGIHAASGVAGKHIDQSLIQNLKRHSNTLTRVELTGWHDMDDIRKLVGSVPGLMHLDVGKKLGVNTHRGASVGPATNLEEWLEVLETLPNMHTLHGVKLFYEISSNNIPAPATNSTQAAPTTLSSLNSTPNVPPTASLAVSFASGDSAIAAKVQSQMSLMDRSRMKKNDWTASMLAWRCPKLRRVDYWEDGTGKMIFLARGPGAGASEGVEEAVAREGHKVRWEVRRIKIG